MFPDVAAAPPPEGVLFAPDSVVSRLLEDESKFAEDWAALAASEALDGPLVVPPGNVAMLVKDGQSPPSLQHVT